MTAPESLTECPACGADGRFCCLYAYPEGLADRVRALIDEWERKADALWDKWPGGQAPRSELLAADHRLHAADLRALLAPSDTEEGRA